MQMELCLNRTKIGLKWLTVVEDAQNVHMFESD